MEWYDSEDGDGEDGVVIVMMVILLLVKMISWYSAQLL